MATFSDLINKITFPIPEEGQVFRTSDNDNIFKRVGNTIYSYDIRTNPELATLQGTLPSFNDADVRGLFGQGGGTIRSTDPNIFKTAFTPPATPETITKTQSLINPNAGLLSSSTQGFLSEGGLNRPGGNIMPTMDPKQYAPPPGTPAKLAAPAGSAGAGAGTPPAPDYSKIVANINTTLNKEQTEEAAKLGEIKIDTKNTADLFAKVSEVLDTGKPDRPSLAEEFAKKRAELGVGTLEDSLANLDGQLAKLDADYASTIEGEEGRRVSMGAIQRRQSALGVEYNRQRRDLVAERDSVSSQLNAKYNSIEMMMKFQAADYENAAQEYDTRFSQALQMVNLISGEQTRAHNAASASLNTIVNIAKDSGKSFADLPDNMRSQIYNLELQAGLPAGVIQEFWQTNPDKKILSTTTGKNAAGEDIVTFVYQDPKTGQPGTITTVKTGGVKQATETETKESGGNARIEKLQAIGLAPAVMTDAGELTKGSRDKILGRGVPPGIVDDIWEAVLAGYSLNEIRWALTEQTGDQQKGFGYLDDFMGALQEKSSSGTDFDNL